MNDVILSRIAEALIWTGRYVERADATGRILDAYLHRMLEDPWRDEDAACRSLYAILGMDAAWPALRHAAGAGPAGLRRPFDGVHRGRARRRPAERPQRPGGRLLGDVGVPQLHLARARRPAARGPPYRPLRLSGARTAARGPLLRARRLHHEPRRQLALRGARPESGAGGHDRTAAVGPGARRGPRARLADPAERVRRRRGVRAPVRRLRRHPAGGRVPAPGPGLPALRAARPDDGGGVPDRARAPPPGPRAPPDRPDADPPRIPRPARPGGATPLLLRDLQTACMASAEAVAERFFPYQGPVEWAQEGAGR